MLDITRKRPGNGDFAAELRAYVAATLHRPIELSRWNGAAALPSFLSHRYDFFAALIGHQPCLFAADRGTTDATPADVAKHLARIEQAFDGVVIYASQHVVADRRSRLVANGVPFVVPGNQLYIPPLALDLREHFHARPKRGLDQLSPVAQAVLFYGILFNHELRANPANRMPSQMARALFYSAMSVGRAFEELASTELAQVSKHGRKKEIHFAEDGRGLIELARPLLRRPARARKFMRGRLIVPPMKVAGESALANTTGMSPPPLPVYAMHADAWDATAAANNLSIVDNADQAEAVIELWHYRPDALTEFAVVDPLSLYAQFWDDPNERIAQAAEDALDHVSW